MTSIIHQEDIKNIYFNTGEDTSPEELEVKIKNAYEKFDHIRMIFNLDKVKVSSITPMIKVKKIFERLGVEKLVETCVYSSETRKLFLVKTFLKTMKTQRPVRFI